MAGTHERIRKAPVFSLGVLWLQRDWSEPDGRVSDESLLGLSLWPTRVFCRYPVGPLGGHFAE